ncbi:MAG: DUF4345 domain-containing protein [Ginsengibacter sp.]|jgi:uncharacterized membrane protein HdeD (DUF308 family)
MEITVKVLLSIVALICFLGGINLLVKGANSFLPANTPPVRILDNLVRFLSGIYFSLSFLVAWVIFHFQQETNLIYFIGLVVIFSGLGRLYSRIKVGSAGKYFDFTMVFEIVLGIVIMLLQYNNVR